VKTDFTNILQAAFKHKNPKSATNTVKLSVFFVLLGFLHLENLHKTLVKLNPGESLFHLCSMISFCLCKSNNLKKESQVVSLFSAFGICTQKSSS